MASNANITSEGSAVAQTPVVTKARRVRKRPAPVKKVYQVGSKAVVLDPHKIVGTITELTNLNSGSISATITIDADGRVISATLNPSDDFWYPPKKTATLFLPGVPGAAVTLAHQRLPHTVEDPKPVPREALGLPPLPAGACDSNSGSADENNAVKGKKRAVDENKGKEAQRMDKAIASGSGTTYTATQDVEARLDEFANTAFSFSAPTLKSEDNTAKDSAITFQGSGSSNSQTSGSISTGLLTATKTTPRTTKRKSDATTGDQSKRPKNEYEGSPAGETVEDSGRVVHNYSGYYIIQSGSNATVQLPQLPAPVIPDGHQPAVYYYDQRYGYCFAPHPRVPAAQGLTYPLVPQQAPMPYQVPTSQAGSPLAPYSAAQSLSSPAPTFSPGASTTPAGYRQTSPQNFQDSPYAMDTRFREQTSPIASSLRDPGTYSQHPQYPQ